jgi:hypothetical protein
MLLRNIPFKTESALMRGLYRVIGARPSSHPFVSGDSFRALADRIFERSRRGTTAGLKPGEIVFVEANYLSDFVSNILPEIHEQFILLTHNGDLNVGEELGHLADDARVLHWYAQNLLIKHPKLTAIPIGLENRSLHYSGVTRDFRRLRGRNHEKKAKILCGFTAANNERERRPAYDALKRSSLTDFVERMNSRDYRKLLAGYAFVASPPGNGVDCHRTWEALYLRSIPIVRRSPFYGFFPGLPVLAVDDWSEILAWKEHSLAERYSSLASQIDTCVYLDFAYWKELILREKSLATSL